MSRSPARRARIHEQVLPVNASCFEPYLRARVELLGPCARAHDVGGEHVLDGSLVRSSNSSAASVQHSAGRCPRCRGTAAARPGTPPRTPRSPRCRRPAGSRPASPARLGQGDRREGRRRRAGRTPRSRPSSSRRRGAASGTRSGQPRPSAIGSRMSGGLAWARVEPSVNSTIECTTDCGCTTTSIRSYGTSNSRCASITSRPLLTMVAELIVTTGPIAQVGWASACSGVTVASSSRRRPRNGPPLAVTHQPAHLAGACRRAGTAPAPSARSPPARSGPARARRGLDQRAAGHQRLLVGQREGAPGAQRGQRRRQPERAAMPLSTTSHGHPASSATASGPATILGSSNVAGGRSRAGSASA